MGDFTSMLASDLGRPKRFPKKSLIEPTVFPLFHTFIVAYCLRFTIHRKCDTSYRILLDNSVLGCFNGGVKAIVYYRDGKEYYFEPSQIMFFEADDDYTYAHTAKHLYRVRYRLYELEEILPDDFIRASKSGLANVRHVLAFSTTVGTTGKVEFYGSLKTLHVSRNNIKSLRAKLSERRIK